MTSISVPKPTFVGGIWTPSLYARTDLKKYFTAVRDMKNFFIHPHGGASNRQGTRYIAEVKDSSKDVRLIPFQFSVVQSYALEFGDQCVRFLKDGGQIVHSPSIEVSIVNSSYKWTLSGAGANEYYLELAGGGDPQLDEPTHVNQSGSGMGVGVLGSLSAGEYAYGDNDSLGYDTIYAEISGSGDPDAEADDFLIAVYCTATSLVNTTYEWNISASGTNEYYLELAGGGDPSIADPKRVYEDAATVTKGTIGSLAASEYAYGDNDSLGFSTIYIRIADSADPDSKKFAYLEASYLAEISTPYLEADLFNLKFTQSADVLYLTHPSYAPRKLTRTAHDVWTLETLTFSASVSPPTGLSMTGSANDYVVTAIDIEGNESVASSSTSGDDGQTLTWNAVEGADYYNVYSDKSDSGMYGWIAQANDASYKVDSAGIEPDFTLTPPVHSDPFDGSGNYPVACAFHEQRLVFFGSQNNPQTFWGSVIGDYENMNKSSPIKDDDSYTHNLVGSNQEVNEIKWAIPLTELIIGTVGSEWKAREGSQTDTIGPTSVNLKLQSKWGASDVPPVVVGNTVLFVDSSLANIRYLSFSLEKDGFTGDSISLLANNLFEGYQIVDWAYQRAPDSIVWCVRSDGALLGLTYYKEHEVAGWHRHETVGEFKSACSIRNGAKSDTYFIVERTINGSVKKYIEIFTDRLPINDNYEHDPQDSFFVDCGLSLDIPLAITGITKAATAVVSCVNSLSNADLIDIDAVKGMVEVKGRYKVENVTANDFELTGETDSQMDLTEGVLRKWTVSSNGTSEYYCELIGGGDPSLTEPDYLKEQDVLISKGSLGSLSAGSWGYGDNDSLGYSTVYVRLTVAGDPDAQLENFIKSFQFDRLDSSSFETYISGGYARKAVSTISGLDHLEGESVAILANGSEEIGHSVSGGSITLNRPASRVHIGLAIDALIDTLDFEMSSDSGTIQDKKRDIKSVVVRLDKTNSLSIGPQDNDKLVDIPFRESEAYGEPTELFSGDKEMPVYSGGDIREARVRLRNTSPLPVTVLSLTARLEFGDD